MWYTLYFYVKGHVYQPAHWFIHLLLPNGLVEMEVLICLYQHVLLSLVKQDASMPYHKLAPSHPIPTWLFQYNCWEYALLLLPFSPFFLHPKWPTLKLEVVNCLPSLFILSSSPLRPHLPPKTMFLSCCSSKTTVTPLASQPFAHIQLPRPLVKHRCQPHSHLKPLAILLPGPRIPSFLHEAFSGLQSPFHFLNANFTFILTV